MDPTGMTHWTGAAPTIVGCGAYPATEQLLTHYLRTERPPTLIPVAGELFNYAILRVLLGARVIDEK